ncbi:MAG: DoxX family membrane protein [Candidatus Heimdallarchaeota archaeon]|nr:DoxX family membrane protein [Candidatus Heimdallarchaeota archaeon]
MLVKIIPDNPKTWIKNNPDRVGIHLLRYMFALLWLSQALVKLVNRNEDKYLDYNDFLGQLIWMKDTNPLGFIVSLLDYFIIPNVHIFVFLVIAGELFIAFSLGFGLFSRLGGVTGALMTISLWVFTLGWGEWLWTYPLIFVPHLLFILSSPGKEIGLDKILSEKIQHQVLNKLLF